MDTGEWSAWLPPECWQRVAQFAGTVATLCLAGVCYDIRYALADPVLLNGILAAEASTGGALPEVWAAFGPPTELCPTTAPPPAPRDVAALGQRDGPLTQKLAWWLAGRAGMWADASVVPLRVRARDGTPPVRFVATDPPACVTSLRDVDAVAPVEAFFLRIYFFWWLPVFPSGPSGWCAPNRAAPWTTASEFRAAPTYTILHSNVFFFTTEYAKRKLPLALPLAWKRLMAGPLGMVNVEKHHQLDRLLGR